MTSFIVVVCGVQLGGSEAVGRRSRRRLGGGGTGTHANPGSRS